MDTQILSKEDIYQYWDKSSDELPWLLIQHFSIPEFEGHTNEISGALVLALELFREKLKKRINISPSNWGIHSEHSWHYRIKDRNKFAQAIDVFPHCNLAYAFMTAIKTNLFNGIGVYPYWSWKNKHLSGGLHLDIRNTKDIKMWWVDQNNKYHYLKNWRDIYSLFTTLLES